MCTNGLEGRGNVEKGKARQSHLLCWGRPKSLGPLYKQVLLTTEPALKPSSLISFLKKLKFQPGSGGTHFESQQRQVAHWVQGQPGPQSKFQPVSNKTKQKQKVKTN